MRRVMSMLVVLLLAVPALAEDLYPPPWRGQPGTTFQHWMFSQPGSPPGTYWPELVNNPFGTPSIVDPWEPRPPYGWFSEWAGMQGVLVPYWELTTEIMNYPEPLPWKDIYVQVTWYDGIGPGGWDCIQPMPYYCGTYQFTEVSTTPLFGDWYHSVFTYRVEPNPPWECIEFWPYPDPYGYIAVDQIVIDTWCVPEPASLLLMAVAGVLVRRR